MDKESINLFASKMREAIETFKKEFDKSHEAGLKARNKDGSRPTFAKGGIVGSIENEPLLETPKQTMRSNQDREEMNYLIEKMSHMIYDDHFKGLSPEDKRKLMQLVGTRIR